MLRNELIHAVYDLMTTAIVIAVVFGPQPAWSAAALACFLLFRFASSQAEKQTQLKPDTSAREQLSEQSAKLGALEAEFKTLKTQVTLSQAFQRPSSPRA